MGVSTRKVRRVLKKMGGFELLPATVSCVARELDEKLTEFRERRLEAHEPSADRFIGAQLPERHERDGHVNTLAT